MEKAYHNARHEVTTQKIVIIIIPAPAIEVDTMWQIAFIYLSRFLPKYTQLQLQTELCPPAKFILNPSTLEYDCIWRQSL